MHIGLCILFVQKWEMGIWGAACALNITYTTNLILQEIYYRIIAREEFEKYLAPLWQRASFDLAEWTHFIKLSLPGVLMVCFD